MQLPVAPGDYSRWTFVINPQYAEIEEGIITITSKASCDAPYEPFLVLDPLTKQYVKHYSINVTGVPPGHGMLHLHTSKKSPETFHFGILVVVDIRECIPSYIQRTLIWLSKILILVKKKRKA